jgi:hypothetical protein
MLPQSGTFAAEDPQPVLFPRLLQTHAGRLAVGEFHSGFFQRALNGGEIVAAWDAPAFFEIDDDVAGHVRGFGEGGLIHGDQGPGGAALRRGHGHTQIIELNI